MKNFLFFTAIVLLAISGCTPPGTTHIARVENAVMGKTYLPRHGEGELFTIDSPLPQGFDRMLLEVVPFEHKLFRIVLEIEELTTNDDILVSARQLVGKTFRIAEDKFTFADDIFTAELAGTRLILRRAFHLGPRAVALEIIDRNFSKNVEQLKNSERFRLAQQRQKIKNELRLTAQALDGYKLDTDHYPETLHALCTNCNKVPTWNGPYCETLPANLFYRKISDTKYELFADFNGEKITEDSEI